MKNKVKWLIGLSLVLAACASTVATVTDGIQTATGFAQATPEAPRNLPDKFEQIAGVDQVPLPQDGPGVWRFYDEQAQVVCYIYGANRVEGGNSQSWSGMSCLPASQTELGK